MAALAPCDNCWWLVLGFCASLGVRHNAVNALIELARRNLNSWLHAQGPGRHSTHVHRHSSRLSSYGWSSPALACIMCSPQDATLNVLVRLGLGHAALLCIGSTLGCGNCLLQAVRCATLPCRTHCKPNFGTQSKIPLRINICRVLLEMFTLRLASVQSITDGVVRSLAKVLLLCQSPVAHALSCTPHDGIDVSLHFLPLAKRQVAHDIVHMTFDAFGLNYHLGRFVNCDV
mmetsp:Transcript_81217/g.143871  ORF Transcript_81217/g.143871 Transcript_81217/m.143871 type:complete len:231 (+) Transcript_81217:527-1219(+)